MGNWVYNYITVTGVAEEVARFKSTCIKDDGMDFDSIIPVPDTYKIDGRDIAEFDWKSRDEAVFDARNEWAQKNWGTLWTVDWQVDEDLPGRYECRVYTSETPPLPVFEKLAKMFPWLSFEIKGGALLWPPESTFDVTIRGGKFRFKDITDETQRDFEERWAEQQKARSAVMSGAKIRIRQLEQKGRSGGDLYEVEVVGENSVLRLQDGAFRTPEGAFRAVEYDLIHGIRFFASQAVPVLDKNGQVIQSFSLDGEIIRQRRREIGQRRREEEEKWKKAEENGRRGIVKRPQP